MMRVAILTVSDSVVAGTRVDRSGPELERRCTELKWNVALKAAVNDDREGIASQLIQWADSGQVQVILTTGGTGVAPRDVTPEATGAVIEREIPGISEIMRLEGRQKTKFSVLSRARAGIRGATLIINLPGSPKGAVESLDLVAELIPHVIDLISGKTEHATGTTNQ